MVELNDIFDALESALIDFDNYSKSNGVRDMAVSFSKLVDSMHDLATYHPSYDYRIGWIPDGDES